MPVRVSGGIDFVQEWEELYSAFHVCIKGYFCCSFSPLGMSLRIISFESSSNSVDKTCSTLQGNLGQCPSKVSFRNCLLEVHSMIAGQSEEAFHHSDKVLEKTEELCHLVSAGGHMALFLCMVRQSRVQRRVQGQDTPFKYMLPVFSNQIPPHSPFSKSELQAV